MLDNWHILNRDKNADASTLKVQLSDMLMRIKYNVDIKNLRVLKLLCGLINVEPCMNTRLWCLKQQILQVNGNALIYLYGLRPLATVF